jgi:hypothetical protein
VRVRDADNLTFVFEDQHVPDFGMCAQLDVLVSPGCEEILNPRNLQLGERQVVSGRVAEDASHTIGKPISIDPGGCAEVARCSFTDARMIVIENVDAGVGVITQATGAQVARTEVATLDVFRQLYCGSGNGLTAPRPVLPMSGDNDPFFS